MSETVFLADELKKYQRICFYPSSGPDLSDIDYFASGQMPAEERKQHRHNGLKNHDIRQSDCPDLFIHTDVNFYCEFTAGKDLEADESGINGHFSVVSFKEMPTLIDPNRICDNYPHSGRCFEYKLAVWNRSEPITLIFCLCENEYLVSQILLPHSVKVPFIWSKNWNGGKTTGTWLANVCDKLHTEKFYTDWLCVPGFRGQPRNLAVKEKYPELMLPGRARLIRNDQLHWIEEGAHGWVEEFSCKIA